MGAITASPDITVSGITPFLSWREQVSPGVFRGFFGHFVNAAAPEFVLDESDVPLAPIGFEGKSSVREPISSGCIATPANFDGSACQGGALGTPFFLFTNGSPLALFADAYAPTLVTGTPSNVATSTAGVSGTVNPSGTRVNASCGYGPTASARQ